VARGSRGLDEFLGVGAARRDLYRDLEERTRAAREKAGGLGRIVGRVSRYEPVGLRPGDTILVEVSPEDYYGRPGPYRRVGDYLVIVDLKGDVVTLARVTRVVRRDLLSHLGAQAPPDPMVWEPDPASLLTQALVEVEPLVEARIGGDDPPGVPVPAVTSIEPQSPVVDPNPEVLRHLLSLPEEGVLLGALATPAGLVHEGSVPVVLPYKALLQHTLVIGTTGSGKTTLLKNMAAYMASKWGEKTPVTVFVDMNQDFVQLAFPPLPSEERRADPVYTSLYASVREPQAEVILLPLPRKLVEEALASGARGWCGIAEHAARKHVEEVLSPIAAKAGFEVDIVASRTTREGTCVVEAEGGGRRFYYVPYAINTVEDGSEEVSGLLHGLTHLAKDFLARSRERFKAELGHYPPVPVMAAGLYAYADYSRQRSGTRENYKPEEAVKDALTPLVASPLGREHAREHAITVPVVCCSTQMEDLLDQTIKYFNVLKSMLPHKSTVEALYRRVSALADSGIADLAYMVEAEGNKVEIAPEPRWSDLISLAEEHRAPIVIDLGWAADRGGVESPRTAAYRMLDRLRKWRNAEWRRRRDSLRPILVVIDEAHQFFPQEKGPREEQESSRQVASMIARIARLGRARGIGLVFATHSPRDLHDIILQLANTKIVLRTEKAQLEPLNLTSDLKAVVPRLPDRYMAVLSHVYREGAVMAATTLPVTMHYDISADA